MRYLLSALLAGAVILVVLWTTASIYRDDPQKNLAAIKQVALDPGKSSPLFLASLAEINNSLRFNPASDDAWLIRGRLLELHPNLAPYARPPYSWENDLFQAIVRSPARVVAWLRLALVCAGGATRLTGSLASNCGLIFQALLSREPQYGYAHFRYGDYLYTQALRTPKRKGELAGGVCKHYGKGLNIMAGTKLMRGWHEKRAYYNCTNLADNFSVMLELQPFRAHQWELLGQGLGRKGQAFCDGAQPLINNALASRHASLDAYARLAKGLAKNANPECGLATLQAYVIRHQDDGLGWKSLVRYIDQNKTIFDGQALVHAVSDAARLAKPELSSGLYFLGKSCQLKRDDLADIFFQKLLALEPQNSAIYTKMARCLMSRGRTMEAIGFYRKALSLKPASASLHIELGRAYSKNKDYNKAVEQFQKALDLNQDDKRAQKELRRMGIY